MAIKPLRKLHGAAYRYDDALADCLRANNRVMTSLGDFWQRSLRRTLRAPRLAHLVTRIKSTKLAGIVGSVIKHRSSKRLSAWADCVECSTLEQSWLQLLLMLQMFIILATDKYRLVVSVVCKMTSWLMTGAISEVASYKKISPSKRCAESVFMPFFWMFLNSCSLLSVFYVWLWRRQLFHR